jgi:hypothetical protein
MTSKRNQLEELMKSMSDEELERVIRYIQSLRMNKERLENLYFGEFPDIVSGFEHRSTDFPRP